MFINDDLKNKVKNIPILDVARSLNINIYRNHRARCFMPGHEDRNPSLTFWPQTNRWKCFSCTTEDGRNGGDGITLVMHHQGLKYNDAVLWLVRQFGICIPGQKTNIGLNSKSNSNKRKVTIKKEIIAPKDILIDHELFEWVVNMGSICEGAKSFLFKERKYIESVVYKARIFSIEDKIIFANEIIENFGIERSINSRLITRDSWGRFVSTLGEKCVVFPYTNKQGKIINLQSRKYIDCNKSFRYIFLPSLPVHLFNIHNTLHFSLDQPLYIAEGVTDCLAMLSDGKNAVAIPGANSFNPDDISILQRHRLIMYPDNDDAGGRIFNLLNDKYALDVERRTVPDKFKDYCEFYINRHNEYI